MSIDERRALCAMPCTLDGAPARVTCAAQDFATVERRDNGLGAQWSWKAVAHVMANKGGAFQS